MDYSYATRPIPQPLLHHLVVLPHAFSHIAWCEGWLAKYPCTANVEQLAMAREYAAEHQAAAIGFASIS